VIELRTNLEAKTFY